MKKNFLFSVFSVCLLTNLAFAQDETVSSGDEVVIIDKVAEKPEDLNLLVLQIPFWHIAASKINTSIYDMKTQLNYVGKGNLNFGVSYKMGFGDRIFPETNESDINVLSNDLVMSQYKTQSSREFNLGATYFFQTSFKEVDQTFRLKQVGQTVYVTSLPVKQQVKMGVNVGYSQGFTWYNMNGIKLSASPQDYSPETIEEISMKSMSTFQEYKFIKLGLNITKSVNTKINAQGYGTRRASWISVDNFNLIVAVQNEFEDVYVGRLNMDMYVPYVALVKYSIDDYNKKLPFGFEYTHQMYSKRSPFSFEYGVKYLPGLMKNFNLMATFGFSFNIDFFKKNNF